MRAAIEKICASFDDDFWLARDRDGRSPHEFHAAIARAGWLGICMPEEYGGAGLGVTEAAIMMRAIAESGGGQSAASSVHMNIFGLNPVVVFRTAEQKRRMLPPLIRGEPQACFAVTEPDAGLNTTHIKTRAARRGDHYVISGTKVWTSTAQVAHKMLILVRNEVSRQRSGISRVRAGAADARPLRLRQGVSRRAVPARGDDRAARPGERAAHHVLHRRESAGPAALLLSLTSRCRCAHIGLQRETHAWMIRS